MYSSELPGGAELNLQLVRTLSADVILVGALAGLSMEEFEDRLEFTAKQYGGVESGPVIGCILNRVPEAKAKTFQEVASYVSSRSRRVGRSEFPLIGAVPENPTLTHVRAVDIARHLNAEVLYAGEIETRRVKNISLLARTVPNMIHTFQAGAMLITPAIVTMSSPPSRWLLLRLRSAD